MDNDSSTTKISVSSPIADNSLDNTVEDQRKSDEDSSTTKVSASSPTAEKSPDNAVDDQRKSDEDSSTTKVSASSPNAESSPDNAVDDQRKIDEDCSTTKVSVSLPIAEDSPENAFDEQRKFDEDSSTTKVSASSPIAENTSDNAVDDQRKSDEDPSTTKVSVSIPIAENSPDNAVDDKTESLNTDNKTPNTCHVEEGNDSNNQILETNDLESQGERKLNAGEVPGEVDTEPIFDGTEVPEVEVTESSSTNSLDLESQAQRPAWPEKAAALKNYVKLKGTVAVSRVFRRLSGKEDETSAEVVKVEDDSDLGSKPNEVNQKFGERFAWNPLNYIKIARNADIQERTEQVEGANLEVSVEEPTMKGRIILYTRLGCQDCKEVRLFLHLKALKFTEINIDIYPSRKSELEKNMGSSAVPKVFFNDAVVGGISELKAMDESGKLEELINGVINDEPSASAPLLPLSGEDDVSGTGVIDELAIIVKKMRESIVVKDRFYKIRRFSNSFLGSEAVDFLSEDQYLEREEAIELGRKLASKYFFRHVLEENVFEDGNHLYRFLDHEPIVLTQCYNIPRGTIDAKPKPLVEIASRLRFLSFAMFEAYVSIDGRRVDYRSIQTSEEFARYLRIVEELQRVELLDLSKEEKMSFFINLYNMMSIHAVVTWGYSTGALERRKFFGDFKYVVGGSTYSLSAIQNGILRGNQRPPYNLMKPFGPKDIRSKVALPYPEPLIHFALVCGNRSGPALRCYSPGNIDEELVEAARDFFTNGGVVVDAESKVASVNKILRWYSVDFGKNEVEVLRHVANYLEPAKSAELLELLANSQLKVVYQPYDWSLNFYD